MHIKILLNLAIAGACCALAGGAHAAGNPEAGRIKFDTCTGCHSIPGYTNAYPTYHVPRLGGQYAEYVIAALKDYQAGNRAHPTMHANAAALSEQDMQDIAAYVAGFKPVGERSRIRGNAQAGEKKIQACVACHGKDGNGLEPTPNPTFPRLAGQYEDYLRKALQDYKAGKRKNAIMSGMVAPLSDQDQADLAAYFASQRKGLVTANE